MAHGVELAGRGWVVNLHASTRPWPQPRVDGERALAAARSWAGEGPLVFGGDLNQTHPRLPGLAHVAGHHVDHVFAAGLAADGPSELLDAGRLSDHRPLAVTLSL